MGPLGCMAGCVSASCSLSGSRIPQSRTYLQASGAKQVFRGDFDPQDSLGLEMRLWVWKTL